MACRCKNKKTNGQIVKINDTKEEKPKEVK